MKRRPQFLAAARAQRQGAPSLLLQARDRRDGGGAVNVGFTCSKKLGNAVMRNRAKRRLRAVAREVLPGAARPGWDYVLIGKPDATVSCGYAALCADLLMALQKVHG